MNFHEWCRRPTLSSLNSLSNIEDRFICFTLKCQNNWCPNTRHMPWRECWVIIEAGTVYWIARAFYKPVSDSKTHKQRCGPAERVAGATTCDTHTHIHILSFCHWQEQKNHISFAAVPKTNTISSSLSCRDLTMNVIDSSSVLTQVWRFL